MYYAIKKVNVMVRIIEYGMSEGDKVRNLYGVGNQVLSHMDIEPMRQESTRLFYKGVVQIEGDTSSLSCLAAAC